MKIIIKQNSNNEEIEKSKKYAFNKNLDNNIDQKENKRNERKKENKIININDRYSYYKKNNEANSNLNVNNLNSLANNNANTYEINQYSTYSSKLLEKQTQNRINTQENKINQEESPKKWYKTKLISKENGIKEDPKINTENKEQININTIKIRKRMNNICNENNKDEKEKNDKIRTFMIRSRLKNKINEKDGKNEFTENKENKGVNQNDNNNRRNNLYLSINDNKINKKNSFRERLQAFNGKNEEKINKERNERKYIKSRKEILKEKEKYDNLNLIQVQQGKESFNINNLNILEKQENKRYTHNQLRDTNHESIKTKENTISHYTKDSYTSKDNYLTQANNVSNGFTNILRNNDSNKRTNLTNDNNKNLNRNVFNTEIKQMYHTKKTRKDYINERNKKNNEILMSDKKKEAKVFIPNKKDILIRTSYQSNKRANIILNNIDVNIDKEEDIPIFDKEIRKDKIKYKQIQYQLKSILVKSCLPKFNIDYYIIKNQIGTGSFGVIFQVYHIKTRCKFALKKIFAPDISTLQKFVKEFELVHQNPHDHILDLIGICIQCVDITNYILYILMDLAEKDWDKEINYRAKIKKYYSENELVNILKQLNSVLYFLQKEKKIAHRDIKPENILIFKNDVYKIGDFGEAKENKIPKQFSTLRGTELYMSPLLYNSLHENKEDVKHNQFKSDMFSLGYCFVYAASLNLNIISKIRDVNNNIALRKILTKEFDGRYSVKLIDLILKMISFNEENRIDFIELEKILREDF